MDDVIFWLCHPRRARRIRAALGDRELDRQPVVRLAATIHAQLAQAGIQGRVYGRCKRLASIHRKMVRKRLPVERSRFERHGCTEQQRAVPLPIGGTR